MKAHYRRDHYERHDKHRDHHDHYRYRDGYRTNLRYDDYLPPEHRVARIIRDTHALIEQSRR